MIGAELKEIVAEVARKVQDARLGREHETRRSDVEETQHHHVERVGRDAAGEIFHWADSDDGRELRLLMAYTGLDMLPLGTTAINLVPASGELLADNCARYMARKRVIVTTANELVRVAGVQNVLVLAERIRKGVIENVVADRLADALRPSVPGSALLGYMSR